LQRVDSRHGEVLLLSDGVQDPADSLAAIRDLRRHGVPLAVLGTGTLAGAPAPAANGGFETAPDGGVQLARLDEAGLQTLANAGGGRYQRLGTGQPLALLATTADRDIGRAVSGVQGVDRWVEQGPWLLLPLLAIAALGFRRGWLMVLVLLIIPPPPAQAFGWQDLWLRPDQQASRLLEQGDATAAAEHFQDPQWRATAHYQAGDYPAAAKGFDGTQPDSVYNRATALARAGQLQEALTAYQQVLEQQPDNTDARFNHDLVEKLLQQQQSGGQQNQQTQSGQSGKQQNQQAQSGQSGKQQNQQTQSGQSGKQQDQQAQSGQSGKQQATTDSREPHGADAGDRQDNEPGKPQPQTAATAQPAQPAAQHPADGQEQKPADSAARARADVAPATKGEAAQSSGTPATQAQDATGRPDAVAAADQPPPKSEQDLALEQWLHQVPDDPAGLLRRKFMLEHLLRQKGQDTP